MAPEPRRSDDIDLSGVPSWVVKLVTDTAETRTSVTNLQSQLHEVAIRLEYFVTRREFDAHEAMAKLRDERISRLWDEHNRVRGQLSVWRWVYAAALALITIYLAAKGTHLVP